LAGFLLLDNNRNFDSQKGVVFVEIWGLSLLTKKIPRAMIMVTSQNHKNTEGGFSFG
jgi:hypothetical protein